MNGTIVCKTEDYQEFCVARQESGGHVEYTAHHAALNLTLRDNSLPYLKAKIDCIQRLRALGIPDALGTVQAGTVVYVRPFTQSDFLFYVTDATGRLLNITADVYILFTRVLRPASANLGLVARHGAGPKTSAFHYQGLPEDTAAATLVGILAYRLFGSDKHLQAQVI